MKKLILFVVILLLTISQITQSQIPKEISYQGVLKLASDVIVPDGEYDLTFKIYDVAAGGDSLWSETQAVSVKGGILDVILGSENAIDLAFDKPYWLGVTVESFPELTPRIELTTAPYSFRAQVAETALVSIASGDSCLWETNGIDAYRLTGSVGIGTSTPSHPLTIDRAGHQLMLGGTATGDSRFGISTFTGSGEQLFTQFDPFTPSSNSNAILRFFRNTNTTGSKALHLLRGNGSSIVDVQLGVDSTDTYFLSGNVGIGTTSPGEKLDVDGTTQVTGFRMPTGASEGNVLTSDASGTGTWQPPMGGMKTGTFAGDGYATKAVTGVGFQPRLLMVYAKTYQAHKWLKSNQDLGTQCQVLDTIEIENDVIISLDPDGFTVGDSSTMNTVGETYIYIAFR